MEATHLSIIQELQQESTFDHGWRRLYQQYAPAMIHYGERLGLDTDTAYDVLQDTMIQLLDTLPDFEYDRERGKFRNYILTFMHRNALSRLRRKSRQAEVSDDLAGEIEDESARKTLEAVYDEPAWKAGLVELALQRLREEGIAEQDTLNIFRAYVIDELPDSEVARRFGTSENAIYQVRHRVIRLIRKQLKQDGYWEELTGTASEEV